jgi:uncharacterized protein YjbI with pentapeptide repeats
MGKCMQILDLDGAVIYRDEQPLQGASLEGIALKRADFEKTQLVGINLSRSRLQGASFDSSNLADANLQAAEFEAVFLSDCGLDRAKLTGADFYEVTAFRASFRAADLTGAKFFGCDFTGADFSSANLEDAFFGPDNILHKTSVRGANLATARLTRTVFKDVLYDDSTKFPAGFIPGDNGLIRE